MVLVVVVLWGGEGGAEKRRMCLARCQQKSSLIEANKKKNKFLASEVRLRDVLCCN